MSFAIFVFDADGDMGFGDIVGPFRDRDVADQRADQIQAAADRDDVPVQVIVSRVRPGRTAIKDIIGAVVTSDGSGRYV